MNQTSVIVIFLDMLARQTDPNEHGKRQGCEMRDSRPQQIEYR